MGWPPTDTGVTDRHDRLPFPRRLIDQPCQYLNFTLSADKSRMRLQVEEFGLSIEPGLGHSMSLAVDFFDQHLRRAPRFVPSPARRGTVARPAAAVPGAVVSAAGQQR